MQRKWIPIAAAFVLATAAVAQPGPGYGPGYGPGAGYGPGMMGGYGGYGGYGPGMMGGYGGGPGMMGGYGGGYGPGMMGGWGGRGGYGVSDLTADQRKHIDEARQDFWKKQWPLMQQMHTTMWSADQDPGAPFDEKAARKAYDSTAGLQKQMFENMIEMRKRTDAVLTPKQREELRREWTR